MRKNDTKEKNKKIMPKQVPYKENTTPLSFEFKVNEFAMRNLNKYRNFMTAPECDCGCGGKGRVVLETSDEVHNFCGAVLSDNDCDECAIFLVYKDGMQEIVHKHLEWDDDEDDEVIAINILSPKNKKILTDIDLFARFDTNFNLHCYGLMIERDDHGWEICE